MITETTMDRQKSTTEMETPGISRARIKMKTKSSPQEILVGTIRIIKTPRAGTTLRIRTLVETRTTKTRVGAIQIRTIREITGTPIKTRAQPQEEIPTIKAILAGITPITIRITILGKTTRTEISKIKVRAGMEITTQTVMLRTRSRAGTRTISQLQPRILATYGTADLETKEILGVRKLVVTPVETLGVIPQLQIAPNHLVHPPKMAEDVLTEAGMVDLTPSHQVQKRMNGVEIQLEHVLMVVTLDLVGTMILEARMADLTRLHQVRRMMIGVETRAEEIHGVVVVVVVRRHRRRLMDGDYLMWHCIQGDVLQDGSVDFRICYITLSLIFLFGGVHPWSMFDQKPLVSGRKPRPIFGGIEIVDVYNIRLTLYFQVRRKHQKEPGWLRLYTLHTINNVAFYNDKVLISKHGVMVKK